MSTFPEWRRDAQAQRLFASSTQPPLSLVEAATLFSYLTMRETDGRDIPAAAAVRVKRHTDYYLGSILMELALYGRVGMDTPTPLENHASYYEQSHKQASWKGLWLLAPPIVLLLACIIAFQHAQQQLGLLCLFGAMAYILLVLLLGAIVGALRSRGKTAEGNLQVL